MKLSAATKTSQDHDETTDHKLVTADHDRVFISTEMLDQDGGHSIGQCREQNKAFSSQCHSALKTAAGQIDQDNTCKPNDAAKDFGNSKLFLMEDDIGNYDCQEYIGGFHDGGLYAGCMCQTDIEEQVLEHCLKQTDEQYIFAGASLWNQDFMADQAAK